MKYILIFLLAAFPVFAQQFQLNDPYPTATVTNEINIQVERYYPLFGLSEKPFTNERAIKLTDMNGKYIAYLYFKEQYTPPKYENVTKILRLYFPVSDYDYIIQRLENSTAFVIYREYKEGHKWGEIYFDKYP